MAEDEFPAIFEIWRKPISIACAVDTHIPAWGELMENLENGSRCVLPNGHLE